MRRETISNLVEDYYVEHIEGEPLTGDVVKEHILEFAESILLIESTLRL